MLENLQGHKDRSHSGQKVVCITVIEKRKLSCEIGTVIYASMLFRQDYSYYL